MEVVNHIKNSVELWMPLAATGVFCLGTFIPYTIARIATNQTIANKYMSRQWMAVMLWFAAMVFVLCVDGEFIKSGVAKVVVGCAAGLSAVFSLSSTIEKIHIRKDGLEINADMRKKGK